MRPFIKTDLLIALKSIDIFMIKHIKFLNEEEMSGEKYQPSSAFLWQRLRQCIIASELIMQYT